MPYARRRGDSRTKARPAAGLTKQTREALFIYASAGAAGFQFRVAGKGLLEIGGPVGMDPALCEPVIAAIRKHGSEIQRLVRLARFRSGRWPLLVAAARAEDPAMSARRQTGGRVNRPPLTPEESEIAHEVAVYVGDMREAGHCWDCTLINIDEMWPHLPYRVAITGLFWAQLAYEQKRQNGRLLQ